MIQYIKILRRFFVGAYRLKTLSFLHPRLLIESTGFYCGYGCFISPQSNVDIGQNFYMGNYCHIAAETEIGDDVLFASYVSLIGGDHKIDGINCLLRKSGKDELKKIIIEDDVWIGHGVIILQGVRISKGAVVAAGSVVTKNVSEKEVVGGNPAKLIRLRK